MEDQPQSENPFFLNLADLLVGILFIFIIILFFFAINYSLTLQENQKIRRFIIESNEIRREILESIGNSLTDEGLDVEVDGSDGVLRLSDSQLFKTGEFDLSVICSFWAFFPVERFSQNSGDQTSNTTRQRDVVNLAVVTSCRKTGFLPKVSSRYAMLASKEALSLYS